MLKRTQRSGWIGTAFGSGRMAVSAATVAGLMALSAPPAQGTALFVTLQDSGQLFELAPGTGAHVAGTTASPVAGIRWAAGIEIGPSPLVPGTSTGLYAAINAPNAQTTQVGNDRIVRMDPDRTTVTTIVDYGNQTANPWDVSFDTLNNLMYVVTDSTVDVYTLTGTPVTSFAHNLIGGNGGGVAGKKPFSIAVDSVSGAVLVTGRDTTPDEAPIGRLFVAGVQVDSFDGDNPGSANFGTPAAVLTNSGHTGAGGTAYVYTFETASGDLLRVYDSSLNLIATRSVNVRTAAGWFTPPDGENVPGMDIDPLTGDIYMVYSEASQGSHEFGSRFNFNETFGNNFAYNPALGLVDVTIDTLVLPEPASAAMLAIGGLLTLRRRK